MHGDFSGTQVTPVREDKTTAPFLELGNYAISRHSWMLADGEAARRRRRGGKQSEWSASWVSLSLVRVTLDSLCPSLLNPMSICVWLLNIWSMCVTLCFQPQFTRLRRSRPWSESAASDDTWESGSLSISLSRVSRSRSVRVYLASARGYLVGDRPQNMKTTLIGIKS